MDRKSGGLGGLKYPLLSDFQKKIAKDYDVLIENEGIALRGNKKLKKHFTVRLSKILNFKKDCS